MTKTEFGLQGRAAIVTGAAAGIGLAATKRLLDEGVSVLGFDLPDADFDALETLQSVGAAKVVRFEGDVADEGSWQDAVTRADEAFGRIDILFNNAGIPGPTVDVLNYPVDAFDKVTAVNVRGAYLGLQKVGRYMKEKKAGVIVSTSSISGFGGGGNIFAYTTSKFALNGMTQSAAIALAPHGVRVLAIAPCPTATDMMFNLERKLSPDAPEAVRPRFTQGIPLGRYGEPEEIAAVLAFLVSNEASFMTGAVVPVDGGVLAR